MKSTKSIKVGANMKYYIGVAFLVALIACSDNSTEEVECSVTVDTIAITDSVKQGDITYYLVHRISGWQDKTEILELYDSKPVFDNCSKSNIEPVYGDSLEVNKSVSHVYLNKKEGVLEIEYKSDAPGIIDNAKLKLEIK